jgi:hypothetical protein
LQNKKVPPSIPVIYNERGDPIEARAGPYEEGGELSLMCVVMGGSPPPTVKWLLNGQELSTELMDFTFPSRLTNKLVVKNLSRSHQHAL